ncbi:hypothetical protein HYH03_011640 [Edaphochlamys debaryana]|uniref:Uncharacterized protein n=1 Tax=Edaphochlamys debaryana TaxID=47281 RepID=A0A836BVA4_9CHLO|nr:hypothetical protein HYH03_011640 [Edaphochlamys debaryana]|eukprot:KAG2489837.1 hypothetical protein HYH03_011640 [Edaphochlamys debaryana]
MRSISATAIAAHGFADMAPTTTPKVLASHTATGVDIRITEVRVAYMDDGKYPVTDPQGKPVKYVTVAATAPKPGTTAREQIAVVQVPAGYSVDAGSIRAALSTAMATGEAQSFMPPGVTKLATVQKQFGVEGTTQTKQWSQWSGGVNSGVTGAPGEIYFDDQGGSFSSKPYTTVTGVANRVSSTAAGFPDQQDTNTDPTTGATRVCRRRVVAGRVRYYCRRNTV